MIKIGKIWKFNQITKAINKKNEHKKGTDYTGFAVPTNPWDFVCSFVVPSNAEELVAEYNKVYKTSYQLLPVSNYDLGEGVTFKAGENQANGEITIKREGMAVVNYLLPLQLGHCSNESIICRDEVCYLQVGRTYTNPIISDKSVPDPSVIRAICPERTG